MAWRVTREVEVDVDKGEWQVELQLAMRGYTSRASVSRAPDEHARWAGDHSAVIGDLGCRPRFQGQRITHLYSGSEDTHTTIETIEDKDWTRYVEFSCCIVSVCLHLLCMC